MHLPPIHTISTSDIFVNGDVTIHESAVVAPGAILQAAPDSRIIVEEGVCVGMGVILNAYQGDIEIKSGAILGAGVLIIGHGEIGHNACIGSTTTILNTSVEAMTVIPAGSLIGDRSRQAILTAELIEENDQPSLEMLNGSELPVTEAFPDPFLEEADVSIENQPPTTAKTETPPAIEGPVVGQVYINQLLFTLFPERRNQNNSKQNQPQKKKE
ncbi:carbon dioxide concentrating mechanism protein [Aphanothece hegewaldii CCALA 016]|uniref:Carbon dioxide concentrating mechanism protein n=1 Tax=Aphanothece hegewaldii CCALA 016 TaxID=2107694 RepID=A0A2T1M058_9CHRO|nr:carbon dioxide concentrating mechanism protein [Aphanothece hegewaldii]PSF38030.1 carbon dioxide concentrating mechanism protein [Aphanothece hegewaldii CCALA 016]